MPDSYRRYANWVVVGLVGVLVLVLFAQVAGVAVPDVSGVNPLDSSGEDGDGDEDGEASDLQTATPIDGESSQEDRSGTAETTPEGWAELTPASPGTIDDPPAEMRDDLQPKPDASFWTTFGNETALSGWSLRGRGEDSGAVGVVADTLALRVDQCYTVVAGRNVGTYDGTIRVSFEWSSIAEEWWERTSWRLVDGSGNNYSYTVVRGRGVGRPDRSSTRTNVTVVEATVDGPVVVEFLVTPSQYCHRANHGVTALYVDELAIEPVSG